MYFYQLIRNKWSRIVLLDWRHSSFILRTRTCGFPKFSTTKSQIFLTKMIISKEYGVDKRFPNNFDTCNIYWLTRSVITLVLQKRLPLSDQLSVNFMKNWEMKSESKSQSWRQLEILVVDLFSTANTTSNENAGFTYR